MHYSEFLKKFKEICEKHVEDGRARAFAFIFYDSLHGSIRRALKEADGYRILNEETGSDMTLFYMHASSVDQVGSSFNRNFLKILNVEDQISAPCIVFFRIAGTNIEDIDFRQLAENLGDSCLIVEDIRRYLKEYLKRLDVQGNISGITWIGSKGLLGMLAKVCRPDN